MLRSLHIENYVLIDSLDVSFPEGLVIISGQTGAGKSILLGALSLLLGSKADASVISDGADSCVVEAVFKVPESDRVLAETIDGLDADFEDGELLIRRVVNKSGRSRAFINDSPVNIAALQSIASRLVDIHSQHQTLLLTDKAFQLSMLDHFAGDSSLLDDCSKAFKNLRSLEKELSAVSQRISRMKEEEEYVKARLQRLLDAKLIAGEQESLEEEQKRLANAEEIKTELGAVEELFSPSDPNAERLPLSSALKEAEKHIHKAAKYLPSVASLEERLESVRMEIDDILAEVSSSNAGTELSQSRLEAVDARLSLLYELMKSFSASSVEELILKRDELSSSLSDSSALKEREDELKKAVSEAERELMNICSKLHASRLSAVEDFQNLIVSTVRSLELERAVFKVEVTSCPVSPTGSDAVRFLFSASGDDPVDAAKCASGGEMSRLMLSLKSVLAAYTNMPTLIFDEIDTGVSGSAADKMGQMICSMGKNMQVFAITHLPQVAAKGSAHYVVRKDYDLFDKAATTVSPVTGEDRVREIARMLSGSTITASAMANARDLLSDKAQ